MSAIAVAPNGAIYVGGMIDSVNGVIRRGIVRLQSDGTLDQDFDANLPNGSSVSAIVIDRNGHVSVGGDFTLRGQTPRLNIARLLDSGAVDAAFGPLLASLVFPNDAPFPPASISFNIASVALTPDDGLAAGGTLLSGTINGERYSNNPFRFSSDGVLDRTNSPQISEPVNALAIQADGLIVAGCSLNSGQNNGDAVRRFLADGGIDRGFAPVFRRNRTVDSHARCLLLESDGRIVVGGDFDQVNGVTRPQLARLLSDGSLDLRFASSATPNGTVLALAEDAQGRILIGGLFTQVQGSPRAKIARLNNPPLPPRIKLAPSAATTSERGNLRLSVVADPEPGLTYQWTKDGVPISGATSADLYLVDVRSGGNYGVSISNSAGKVSPPTVSVVVVPRSAGSLDYSFSPATGGIVIPRPDGRIYVGSGTKMALLEADGRSNPTFQLDTGTGPPGTSKISGGSLLPDGRLLLMVVRAGVNSLERYLPDGTWDSSFALRGLPVIDVSGFVVQAGGSLVLGGKFDPDSTTNPVRVLVKTDSDGRYDRTFLPPTFAWPSHITRLVGMSDGSFVATGDFQTSLLDSGESTLRFLPDGSRNPNWHRGFGSRDQLLSDGSLFFSNSETGQLYKVRSDGSIDPSFDCLVQTVDDRGAGRVFLSAANPTLSLQSDGRILLSGTFGRVNGASVQNYARILANGSLDTTFVSPVFELGGVAGLSEIAGMIYATGTFHQINGVLRPGLARLFRDGLDSSRIVNLSARANAGDGSSALVAGFVLAGDGNCPVLVRGVGPALTNFGVNGALAGARLELFQGDHSIGLNTGWAAAGPDIASVMQRLGAFSFSSQSADAALFSLLPIGDYTATVAPSVGPAGVGLAEVYSDSSGNTRSWLANLAARAEVRVGSPDMIAGFSVVGSGEKQILVRAIGPTLTSFGVPGALLNPRLKLFGPNGEIAENDDWALDANAGFTAEAARRVGAFALDVTSRDAALLHSLPPGNYTVIAESADGKSGIALIEIYEVTH